MAAWCLSITCNQCSTITCNEQDLLISTAYDDALVHVVAYKALSECHVSRQQVARLSHGLFVNQIYCWSITCDILSIIYIVHMPL
jgi:hypothetical protein